MNTSRFRLAGSRRFAGFGTAALLTGISLAQSSGSTNISVTITGSLVDMP